MLDHKIYKKKREEFKNHDGCEVKSRVECGCVKFTVKFWKQDLPDKTHEWLQPVGGGTG